MIFVGQNIIGGTVLKKLLSKKILPRLIITRTDNEYENEVIEASKGIKCQIIKTNNLNTDENAIRVISELKPEIVFCAAWPHRIKEPLLNIPSIGWVNLHPSLLPAYRGSSPITWVLINGENKTGASAHFMTKGFDEGNVIYQLPVNILPTDNAESLKRKCATKLGQVAVKSYQILKQNLAFQGKKQNENQASYFPPRENNLIINPNWSIDIALNHIRGLSPYPCIKIFFKGKEYRIAKAQPVNIIVNNKEDVFSRYGKLYFKVKGGYLKIVSIRDNNTIKSNYKV